jgi:hypothetical protein
MIMGNPPIRTDKHCYKCRQIKPIDLFFNDKARSDGKSTICRKCSSIRRMNNLKRQQVWMRYVVNRLKTITGCQSCGERDPEVLQFHHLDRAQKAFTVAHKVRANNTINGSLTAELRKCTVLCVNCHRKVHSKKLVLLNPQPFSI